MHSSIIASARLVAGDGRPGRRAAAASFPSAYYYRVAALVFVFALAVRGPQHADGLCRAGQPRPCRLLRDRRLRRRHRPAHLGLPSWLASARRRRAVRRCVAFVVGRPILRLKGHYLAVATLGFGLLVAIVLTNEAR